ncbi:MAG TPA: lipase family protein [Solirubrobacteraceae bacterium]
MAGGDLEARKRPFRRPGRRKLILGLLAAVILVAAAIAWASGGDTPSRLDAFYVDPDPLPNGRPGTILRSQSIAHPPGGTLGWKLLYISRSYTGKRAALSAVVFVPNRAAASNGRNVVVFAHPVLGIAARCAPSLDPSFWPKIPGLMRFLRAGDAVVMPDYEGLGTAGGHPLFVGPTLGRQTLDAVRAANRFEPAAASTRFVAWGTSEGGHTALFAGQEAESYAPELELAGIAAGAPATVLEPLFDVNRSTIPGQILATYLLVSWGRVYSQLGPGEILAPGAEPAADRLAKLCVPADSGPIDAPTAKLAQDVSFALPRRFRSPVVRRLLARNSPGARSIPAPILITQGTRDQLVRPALTRRFVRRLCAQGASVQYRVSPGVAHRDVAEKTAPYAANWIAKRFEGRPVRSTC